MKRVVFQFDERSLMSLEDARAMTLPQDHAGFDAIMDTFGRIRNMQSLNEWISDAAGKLGVMPDYLKCRGLDEPFGEGFSLLHDEGEFCMQGDLNDIAHAAIEAAARRAIDDPDLKFDGRCINGSSVSSGNAGDRFVAEIYDVNGARLAFTAHALSVVAVLLLLATIRKLSLPDVS